MTFAFANEDGVSLRVFEPSGYHGPAAFYVGGKFAGHLGDYIALAEGRHEISIKSRFEYTLYSIVTVEGGSIRVNRHDSYRSECNLSDRNLSHELSGWPEADLVRDSTTSLFQLVLAPPVYRSRNLPQERCFIQGMEIELDRKKAATVKITSVPEGAEILYTKGSWDRPKSIGPTNQSRVFWHDDSFDEEIRIVLRLSGYMNCAFDINTKGRGDFRDAVHCDMIAVNS